MLLNYRFLCYKKQKNRYVNTNMTIYLIWVNDNLMFIFFIESARQSVEHVCVCAGLLKSTHACLIFVC